VGESWFCQSVHGGGAVSSWTSLEAITGEVRGCEPPHDIRTMDTNRIERAVMGGR
jgi:hypothetical protein